MLAYLSVKTVCRSWNWKFDKAANQGDKNQLNLWKKNKTAEDWQHLLFTLHSYPNLYVAFNGAYLFIYTICDKNFLEFAFAQTASAKIF